MVELILPLYNNLLYVKGDKDITVTLDHTANHINPPKWRQYVTFQSEYKERIGLLRREQRAVPKEVGGDKIMPPILQIYEGKFNSAQPVKNFKKGLSCAFCEAQVNKYEELNQSFINATKLAAPAAASKIIPLLLMDIAYLKSFEVEWERTAAALETEGAHGDDDDDEIDTSSWDPADPATANVPFKTSSILQQENCQLLFCMLKQFWEYCRTQHQKSKLGCTSLLTFRAVTGNRNVQ